MIYRKSSFILLCIFLVLISFVYAELIVSMDDTLLPRVTITTDDSVVVGDLGDWMYLNIENSYVNPVLWNITQESSDTYRFVIKAGRHWEILGGEIE